MSSAYMSRLNICSETLTPHWVILISLARSFMNTANKVGAKLSPCRTPDEIENQSVKLNTAL